LLFDTFVFLSFVVAFDMIVINPLLKATVGLEVPEDDEDEEPFFIPTPFTVRSVRSEPYSGSDPEWQAFIKVSKDRDLQERIMGRFSHAQPRRGLQYSLEA
jgi:hypothetical protein